jgi:uncharacterized membrane protein
VAAAPGVAAAPAPARAGWLATRWDRLNGPQRVAGVDLARGLAVIGMVAAHLLWLEDFDFADAGTWLAVVDGRSSIVFATLAGVSIGLVTGGPRPLAPDAMRIARRRLAVRAGMLWLLGIWLIATGVPVYVILPAYAVLFLLALPLVALGTRALLLIAGAIALVMPFVQVVLDGLPFWRTTAGSLLSAALGWNYPFPVWLAFVLAGLAVARAGILRTRVQLWMVAAGSALTILGYGLDGASGPDAVPARPTFWEAVWTAEPHSSGLLEVIGSGGFAIALIGLCVLACRTVLTWVVLPLRAVGAMPLTAYTAQILAWALVAFAVLGTTTNLRAFRDLEPFVPMTVWLVLACTAWALLVGRGPLEWLVDRIAKLAVPRRVDRLNG